MSEDFWNRAIKRSLAECFVAALAEGARNGREGPEQTLALMRMEMNARVAELTIFRHGPTGSRRDVSAESLRRMKTWLDAIEADTRMRLGLVAQSQAAQ